MIHKHFIVGGLALAAASLATTAWAAGAASRVDKDGGFYATPIQKGAPRDLPGEQLIPGVNVAVDIIDGIARPLVVAPIQTAGASLQDPFAEPAAAAAAGPKATRRHRGHKHVHLAAAHHHKHHHAAKKHR